MKSSTEPGHLRSVGVFVKELISNPRHIGAAIPSSERLAKRMASFVPSPFDGLVVELGAGTGVVTAALLKRGISPQQLLAVELSPKLAGFLQKRFPALNIVHGDASHLGELVKQHQGKSRRIDMVVSSLPLRSLPASTLRAIEAQLHEHMNPDGRYIQFTYDVRRNIPSPFQHFVRCESSVVWLNVPPARVDVFRRKKH